MDVKFANELTAKALRKLADQIEAKEVSLAQLDTSVSDDGSRCNSAVMYYGNGSRALCMWHEAI